MKYIKTYEVKERKISKSGVEIKYNIGDYVLLKDYKQSPWNIDLECKILDINEERFAFLQSDYKILSYNNVRNEYVEHWIAHYNIQRKLKPIEIIEFELKQTQNKYNL